MTNINNLLSLQQYLFIDKTNGMKIRKMINQGKGFDLLTNSLDQFVKEYVEISQGKFASEHLTPYVGRLLSEPLHWVAKLLHLSQLVWYFTSFIRK